MTEDKKTADSTKNEPTSETLQVEKHPGSLVDSASLDLKTGFTAINQEEDLKVESSKTVETNEHEAQLSASEMESPAREQSSVPEQTEVGPEDDELDIQDVPFIYKTIAFLILAYPASFLVVHSIDFATQYFEFARAIVFAVLMIAFLLGVGRLSKAIYRFRLRRMKQKS